MTFRIAHNQSLPDTVLQYYGTLDALIIVAQANSISVTQLLVAGTTLVMPFFANSNAVVRDYYLAKGIQPATGLRDIDIEENRPDGIGFMAIGTDFIVN